MCCAGGTVELCSPARSLAPLLTDRDIDEIRSLRRPPVVVRRLLEVVFFLLLASRPRHRRASSLAQPHTAPWPQVHALLNSPDFRERLVSFDPSCLRASPGTARRLWAAYFGPEAPGGALRAEAVRRASASAAALYDWASAALEAGARAPSKPRPGSAGAAARPGSAGRREAAPPEPPEPTSLPRLVSPAGTPPATPTGQRLAASGSCPQLPHAAPAVAPEPPALAASRSAVQLRRLADAPRSPPCLRTIALVVGGGRRASLAVAATLLEWPATLVVLLAMDAETCAWAEAELAEARERCPQSKLRVEQMELRSEQAALESAKRAMCRLPSIRGLVLDVKAFPEPPLRPEQELGLRLLAKAHGASRAFFALRPHFAGGARILVVTSPAGAEAAARSSEARRGALFGGGGEADDLARAAQEFAEELVDGPPRLSAGGWWLDAGGFAWMLLHALLSQWHRKYMRLCICACACPSSATCPADADADAAEAESIAKLMSKPPAASSALAGRLFGCKAAAVPWFPGCWVLPGGAFA